MAAYSYEEECRYLQQHLLDQYKTRCYWENPVTNDQQCISEMYVPPAVKLLREKDGYGGLVEVKQEQYQSSSLTFQQVFSSRSNRCENIYITGDAGTGKTSFCNQLVLTWCKTMQDKQDGTVSPEDLKVLLNFKFLFYINLREAETIYHVVDMIKEQLMPKVPISIDIPNLLRTEKCLVVFDALDEWSCPDGVRKCPCLNKNIPGRYAVNKTCVFLTTTRNWKLDVSDVKSKDIDKHIELGGIDKKSAKELAQKTFVYLDVKSQRNISTDDFYIELHKKKLTDLINLPVLLVQLVTMWHCGKHFGNSQLQLYCSMLDLLFECSEKNLPEKQSESACKTVKRGKTLPDCLSTKYYCQSRTGLLMCLAKLAYSFLFNKQKEEAWVFKSSALEIFGISPSDIKLCLQCGIFSQSRDFRNYTGRYKRFSFLHKRMQEFFAALHIVTVEPLENTLKGLREFCISVDIMLEMSRVWLFASGMRPEITRRLLEHFMHVVTADSDKWIQNYRQNLGGEELIRDIQTCVTDCLMENGYNSHTYDSFNLENFYIDQDTVSLVERLFPRAVKSGIKSMYLSTYGITAHQLKAITDILLHSKALLKLHLNDLLSRIPSKTVAAILQKCCHRLTCLDLCKITLTDSAVTTICQSSRKCLITLRLHCASLTHADTVRLVNKLSQSLTIRQLALWLECTDHDRLCRPRIDMAKMTSVQRLDLYDMCVDNLPSLSQCIEKINLGNVTLPVTALCEFALGISQKGRDVTVKLDDITILGSSEDHVDVKAFFSSCPDLTVTLCQFYDTVNMWRLIFHTKSH